MKIKKIRLNTRRLDLQRQFYERVLGFEVLADMDAYFTVKVGWTELTFSASSDVGQYHFCFLIPRGSLKKALLWLEDRADVVVDEDGRKTHRFDHWNADSLYFYDADGNLAEFIVRQDLKYELHETFSQESVLGLNEIGFPVRDIASAQASLFGILGSCPWQGDEVRFGTHGDQEGLILLPNYEQKRSWFPTNEKITCTTFDLIAEHEGVTKGIRFHQQKIRELPLEAYLS